MYKLLSKIGYHGPVILFFLIIIELFKNNYTNSYIYIAVIIWQVLNHLLNVTIKNILKHPRPDSIKDEIKNIDTPVTISNYLTIHKSFGMPSGHAQSSVSELTFIAMFFKNPTLTTIASIQTALTLWQRYNANRHSITQLSVGSLIGVAVGGIFYKNSLRYLAK